MQKMMSPKVVVRPVAATAPVMRSCPHMHAAYTV